MKDTVGCHIRTGSFHKRLFYMSVLKKDRPEKYALHLEENTEISKGF